MKNRSRQKKEPCLDIPLELKIEVGRTNMRLGHFLQLQMGDLVSLDRLAEEPVNLLINGAIVAQGEIKIVNGRFGIRLVEVADRAERLRCLGGVNPH